jgi:hypothetical protein
MDMVQKLKKQIKILKRMLTNREGEIKQIRNQLRKVEQLNLEIKEGLI